MKITTRFPYKARHVPPRGKNFRETPVYENLRVEIAEPTDTEAPVSARVGLGVAGNSHSFIVEYEFRWFNDAHWVCMTSNRPGNPDRTVRPADLIESIETGQFFLEAASDDIQSGRPDIVTAYEFENPIPLQHLQAKEFDEERRNQARRWLAEKSAQIFFADDKVWQRINEPVFVNQQDVVVVRPFSERIEKTPSIFDYVSLNASEQDLEDFQQEAQDNGGTSIRVSKRDILIPEAFQLDHHRERFISAVGKMLEYWWTCGSGVSEGENRNDWEKVDEEIIRKWFELRREFTIARDELLSGDELLPLEEAIDNFVGSISRFDRGVVEDCIDVIDNWKNRPLELTAEGGPHV